MRHSRGGLSVLTAGVCWHGGKTIHPLHLGKKGPGSEEKRLVIKRGTSKNRGHFTPALVVRQHIRRWSIKMLTALML